MSYVANDARCDSHAGFVPSSSQIMENVKAAAKLKFAELAEIEKVLRAT